MTTFFNLFKIPDLRKRILFTILVLIVYRLGGHVPISGVDLNKVKSLFDQGGVLGFINLFSGGGLSRVSIFALGIIPFINASIIMQLLTVVWPSLKSIAEEGESGRKQISQYTRYLSLGLALIQAIVFSVGFKEMLLPETSFLFFSIYAIVSLVAGASLVMWLGEVISDRGIGNGASLIIFIGIIAQMPFYIKNTYLLLQAGASPIGVIFLVLILVLMIAAIVFVQEAQRNIPVQYAKKVIGRKMLAGQNTYIPLRLIQGGVLPIIFASALLQFPLMFSKYINIPLVQSFFTKWYQYDGILYNSLFCFLIFFFTYFYTAITFNPNELAENIKKHGGFIVGVRPGKPTVAFLESIITRLTLFGAMFLSLIALIPVIAIHLTNVNSFAGLGGTALLIIVGVALDLVKQIETYLINHRYEGLIG